MASSSRSGVSICCQFFLLILQVCVQMVEGSEVTLLVVEGASEYHPPTVTLICNSGSGGPVGFFVEGEHGTARNVTLSGNENIGNELTIDIDVTNEGVYFCAVGGQISNKVPLVAIPFSDPDIVRSYSAGLGENVVLPCTIPIGPLQRRYSVRWFKGLTEVDPGSMAFQHIRLNRTTFELEFNGVRVSDDSRAYFCEVNVTRREGLYRRRGATVALNVVDDLRLVRGLSSRSVQVGEVANFSCLASGVPAPQFKWLLNGSERAAGVSGRNETRTLTIDVESSLALSTTVQHTGPVTCLAYHERDGQIFTVTSTANLVVLTGNFEIELRLFDDEVRVQGTLPVPIAGFFSLQLRFSNSMGGVELNTISDSSLADTDKINVLVPREKLPSFNNFQVSVAIMSDDEVGPYTVPSNMLSLPSNFKGTCPDCDVSSYVAVVAVLVVLLVVMVLILILVVAFCYYKKGVFDMKPSREYTMSPRETMSRSVSRNSCGSHKSALSYRSSRSRSCSSQSAHSSEDSHSASRCVSTPVPGSRASPRVSHNASPRASPGIAVEPENVAEAPKDIRDYETIDHKMLKQWQEQRGHPDSRLGGSCERVAPPPVRVNEPIFPCTHIGVPNPRQQRDSGSSFEDLETECMELSMGAPKSC